jgi:hypothetical protein
VTPRVALFGLAAALTLAAALLLERRRDLRDEIGVLERDRSALTDSLETAVLTEEVDRVRLQLERARAQPERTAEPHIAVAIGGSALTLERAGIVLRSAAVAGDVARGVRTVQRIEDDGVELSGGVALRPVRTPSDSAGAVPGTLWVGRHDFDAIRASLRRGTVAYLH